MGAHHRWPLIKAKPARHAVLAGSLLLAALAGCSEKTRPAVPDRPAEITGLAARPEISAFYAARDWRPLWTTNQGLRPEGEQLLSLLRSAVDDGLDASRYLTPELTAAVEGIAAGAPALQADALLSKAFADYISDLHRPAEAMVYVDQQVAPARVTPRQLLDSAANAPSLRSFLLQARRMNPIYEGLRAELAKLRRSPDAAGKLPLLRMNLERARLIPADPGPRYVVVDAAGAKLWLFENGEIRDEMRVVVGRRGMQTPMMAGLIRFAVLNPYWNIPKDLVRDQIAPRVLREGTSYIEGRHFEVLSDFTPAAYTLDPSEVDWTAVASGAQPLKMRQLPGQDNMMGAIKFMFPNRLGIYLHDTPAKGLFDASDRLKSSGCVRVEDAARLSRWLFGRQVLSSDPEPERRVDLTTPVPVYITYLTAVPQEGGIEYQPDVYGRDRQVTADRAAASTHEKQPS
jgi:murein L,D-transpeptidase YcbB/YkuD